MRTYGDLAHHTPAPDPNAPLTRRGDAARPLWGIKAEPHVAMRIKRLFGRVRQSARGQIVIGDTPEVARDLVWLMQRYPLRATDDVLALLHARAAEQDRHDEAVQAILDGRLTTPAREPARPLRDYQRQAADLVLASGRLLLTDDVGLGKTTSAIGVLRDPSALPAVFVTLTHLPEQMLAELGVVLPWLAGHVVQGTKPYDPITKRGVHRQPDVLFISYSKLAGWADHLAGVAKTVIFDEIQELRREDTRRYEAAAVLADAATYVMGLTATPVYNYGGEMFNVMSIIAPDALGSRDEFTREWGAGYAGAGGSFSKLRINDPRGLGSYLREQGLMLGRTRAQVGRELPEVTHVPHVVDADADTLAEVATEITDLAERMLHAGGKDTFLLAGMLDYRLRQQTGIAKAPYVAEFVKLLLESEQRVVLYGWHRAVYDIWLDRLTDYNPVLYTGSESPTQKAAAKKAFVDGDSRVLIMSLRSGAGLDGLQGVCSVVVFGELDWSPKVHEQAVGRVHRDGQSDPVLAYFLHTTDGSDPVVMEVLNVKRMQSQPITRPDEDTVQATDAGDRMRRLAESVLTRAGRPLTGGAENIPADIPAAEELADVVPAIADRDLTGTPHRWTTAAALLEQGPPVPARITQALDLGMHQGPEVDFACGGAEPMVDEWEAGTRIPTAHQLELLADLTGFPIDFFFTEPPVRLTGPGHLCIRSGPDRGCHPTTAAKQGALW